MRALLWVVIGALVVCVLVVILRPSDKHTMEHLVMPGPVIAGHAKIEQKCSECHAPFQRETQDQLCLGCHKDVAKDVSEGQGFHGRFGPAKDAGCNSCHTDHRGRDADVVRLDRDTFRHDLTDFPLRGGHVRAGGRCDACHVEGKRFREAPTDCASCHRKDDVHKGQLGDDCAKCHQETLWKEARFDHGTTRFPLTDKHQGVACYACHTNQTYKNAPMACIACHLVNDVHDSKPDERCERCHNAAGWK